MRRCPGNGGRQCGTYMSPLFRDPHPTSTRCRGRSCSFDTTRKICDGWSLDQWQHYRRKRTYAERSKSSSRHAGDPIDTASNPPLSPTSTRSVSPPPPSLPLPSEGSGEGREAPSVNNIITVNVDEPRVSSPTSMPSREHGESGRDTPRVGNGEGEAASTSLASAGGGRSLPGLSRTLPLDDKLPSSPSKFRPKISSVHHVDDWGGDGEDRAPSPAQPPHPQAKGKRGSGAIDHTRAADFYKKSVRRRSAPARPRSPPVRALPAGGSRIHWGLIRPYDAHAEFGEHVARPRDEAARHNSVASSVWQRAEARNRSRAREPDAPSASYPRQHQRSDSSNCPRSWAPQSRTPRLQPSPSDLHHRANQPPGYRAARHGTPWITQPTSARTKRSDHERPLQRISAERGLPQAFYSAARTKQKPANSRIPRGRRTRFADQSGAPTATTNPGRCMSVRTPHTPVPGAPPPRGTSQPSHSRASTGGNITGSIRGQPCAAAAPGPSL